MKRNRLLSWTLLLVFAVAVVACSSPNTAGQPPVSVLSQEEAAAMTEAAMQGFARADYAAWSRDWSPAMQTAIGEAAFLAYQEEVSGTMGAFRSIENVTIAPSPTEGYVRWVVVADFENGQMEFAFSFRQDGRLIEGIFPRRLG